jgi:hypothetical protein
MEMMRYESRKPVEVTRVIPLQRVSKRTTFGTFNMPEDGEVSENEEEEEDILKLEWPGWNGKSP